MYDYLLVVGPGRSGSDFLFRVLREHPDYVFPEIKEGAYYRSLRAYRRARRKVLPGKLLCDIANNAYHDPRLAPGIRELRQNGVTILLVILVRDHRDRAVSMIRFRKSRGRPSALLGTRHLERGTLRDRLTPATLETIFGLDVDILTVDFATLVNATPHLLARLAALCQTAPFGDVTAEPANVSVRARFIWLSTLGWLCALALRKLGLTRLLQRTKDASFVHRVFFRAPRPGIDAVRLDAGSERMLRDAHRECWSVVKHHSIQEAEGIFLRRASGRRTAG